MVAVLIGIAICEVMARLVAPISLVTFPVLYNGEITYEPNQRQRYVSPEWDYEISINADGFRDNVLLQDLPPKSAVFVGDSFIEGYGLPLEDTVVKKLERILASKGRGGVIYNAGHNNTSPNNYSSVWENYFSKRSEIESVLVGFFIGNDLLEGIKQGHLDRGKVRDYESVRWTNSVRYFLSEHSVLYNLINYTLKANRSAHAACRTMGFCGAAHPDDIYLRENVAPLLRPTIERMREFAEAVRRSKQRMLVVLIPTKDQISDDGWNAIRAYYAYRKPERFYANDAIVAAFRANCIPVLDLTGPFLERQRAREPSLYFQSDGHWSAAGTEFAAHLIADVLASPEQACASYQSSHGAIRGDGLSSDWQHKSGN